MITDTQSEAKDLTSKLGLTSGHYEAEKIITEFLGGYALRVEMKYKQYLERAAKKEPLMQEYRAAHPLREDEEIDSYEKAASQYAETRLESEAS